MLLVEAYQKPAWLSLMASTGQTQAQINAKKAAINGHPDQTGCHGWYNAFGSNGKVGNYVQRFVVNNTTGALCRAGPGAPTNNCQLPFALVYAPPDPVTDSPGNPTGARCSAWDWAQSIFGQGRRPRGRDETRDNVGVQYGLKALLSGAITTEEFVTLNEIVGGVDKDSELHDHALGRRPRGARDRLPLGHRDERPPVREDRGHRHARLGRLRAHHPAGPDEPEHHPDPLRLAQLLDPRPPRPRVRRSRQPRDVALRALWLLPPGTDVRPTPSSPWTSG